MQSEFTRLAIFGSTGSIGTNTLDVVRRNRTLFGVQYLTTNTRIDLLAQQIDEFHPVAVVVIDERKAEELRRTHGAKTKVLSGSAALEEIASESDYDTFVGGLVGFAGLRSTARAIERGKRICIANKETLVVAGEQLTQAARASGSTLEPVDSEHSAIAQCLVGESHDAIARLILTASGGPFRTRSRETFDAITVEEALRHPNWVMGKKITIDSATLMNKGLEIIEARWLFDVTFDRIEVVVHPQSIVHSMVEFVDGSIKAQLGPPDMRLPIQYALRAPERIATRHETLDIRTLGSLEFSTPDIAAFPCLRLSREAGLAGGLAPTVLNAANEAAVALFLDRRIAFTAIPTLIEEALDRAASHTSSSAAPTLDEIEACDREVRRIVLAAHQRAETAATVVT